MSGTSAKRHDGAELCNILNRTLREDDPNATVHAAVFANALNLLLVGDGPPQPWLRQVLQKSFMYVVVVVVDLVGLYSICQCRLELCDT